MTLKEIGGKIPDNSYHDKSPVTGGRKSPKLREIDILSLDYVPLPRSPKRWEETQSGRTRVEVPESEDHFEVHNANWQILSVEKIKPGERPDPAFRIVRPNVSGLMMIDDLGKAENLGHIEAAALRYDRSGNLVVKAGLLHGVYRFEINPFGNGLIAMSRDCVAHAYNNNLKPILEQKLVKTPEIRESRKRFAIGDDELKNHIRCVALSHDESRYLFTVVDEAWCVDIRGETLWGAKLPMQNGWKRVNIPSDHFGTSEEVDRALILMNLSFPIAPEDVKRRYRELAKQWHPDLNPGNPQADKMMKALNAATEILTGVDTNDLPSYTEAEYVYEMSRNEFEVGGMKFTVTAGYGGDEAASADWIYAASFAANSGSLYLAGYSGRVVLLNEKGEGVLVYDIGSVPRRIVDTGDYLYLLTDTRLYVLRGKALYSLNDTLDGGDLLISRTGFALLEKKRISCFLSDGTYLGSVLTKDPIRRIYSSGDAMVIETRQRRAMIQGVPGWY